MKKLFFSAVFLMAFSSVSMANTIAENQVVINNELQVDVKVEIEAAKIDICAIIAIAVYIETISAGIIAEEASQEALAAYNECIRNQ